MALSTLSLSSNSDIFYEKWMKLGEGKTNSKALSLVQVNERIQLLQDVEKNPAGKKSPLTYKLLKKCQLVRGVNGGVHLGKLRVSDHYSTIHW